MKASDYRFAANKHTELHLASEKAYAALQEEVAKAAKVYSDLTGDVIDDEDPRYFSIVQEMLEVAEAFDLHAATDVLIRHDYGDDKECWELAKKIRRRIQK